MRIQPIRNIFLLMRARFVTFSMPACNGKGWCTYTYSLSPLRACSLIRTTPRNAIVVCSLPALRPAPNSTREPSSLAPRTFSTSLLVVPSSCFRRVQRMATLRIDVGGILLTWPIHLHRLFFTSNEMGSIPVRLWSSALVIL